MSAWEQRKLGESCKSFTDGDWIESKDQSESGVRLLQTGNVGITNFIEKDNKKWITEETFNRLHCSEVCPGDILISRLPEPAGRACIVPDIGYKMITAVDCTIVKNDENFSNEFLVQFLSTPKYFNTVNDFLAGGTRQRISRSSLSKFDVLIPEINEQTKIGAFFSKLDNLITLHQRKYEKLKNVKKSMLEKMFPKNNSKFPEIRFKGFTDAWEQRKLGETVKITMGQSPDGSTYSDTPSDYILVQGNADLQNGYVVPRIWTTQITKKAEAGDLIMSVRAPAGTMGKTKYDVVIGRGVASIKGNEFIYQSLVKMDEIGYWKRLSCGSTFESLNSDNIQNAELLIPHNEEQTKIGAFFSKLDNLITLHQRKCEKLKNIKKSMLEKMFV